MPALRHTCSARNILRIFVTREGFKMMVLLLPLKFAVRNFGVPSVNRGSEREYVVTQRNNGQFDKHSRADSINSLWLVQKGTCRRFIFSLV
jgi:hypothetical protein